MLSPRERATIREVNETAFALNFLETGGTVGSESREKVGYSMLSTDLHFLYFVVSTLQFLTSDHQVLLSRARQLFVDCTRVVPSEVIGCSSL